MPNEPKDQPTFEQLIAWIVETAENEMSLEDWLRERERKEAKPDRR